MKIPENIQISGPYYEFSKYYGIYGSGTGTVTLERDEWYVSRLLKPHEQKTEMQKILKSTSLGHITKFRKHNKDYVINQLFPYKGFKTLQGAINFLIKNEGKLVFCT